VAGCAAQGEPGATLQLKPKAAQPEAAQPEAAQPEPSSHPIAVTGPTLLDLTPAPEPVPPEDEILEPVCGCGSDADCAWGTFCCLPGELCDQPGMCLQPGCVWPTMTHAQRGDGAVTLTFSEEMFTCFNVPRVDVFRVFITNGIDGTTWTQIGEVKAPDDFVQPETPLVFTTPMLTNHKTYGFQVRGFRNGIEGTGEIVFATPAPPEQPVAVTDQQDSDATGGAYEPMSDRLVYTLDGELRLIEDFTDAQTDTPLGLDGADPAWVAEDTLALIAGKEVRWASVTYPEQSWSVWMDDPVTAFAFAPDMSSLALVTKFKQISRVWTAPLNAAGPFTQLWEAWGIRDVGVLQQGDIAVVRPYEIVQVAPVGGAQVEELLHPQAEVLEADFSADGAEVVYTVALSGTLGWTPVHEVWLTRLDTGVTRQLTGSHVHSARRPQHTDAGVIVDALIGDAQTRQIVLLPW